MSNNYTQRTDGSIENGAETDDGSAFEFKSGVDSAPATNGSGDDSTDVTLEDVRDVVTEEFDEGMWGVTEALLAAHTTLLIDEVKNCTGVIIVGDSGAGKTTAIRFFEGLDGQVYRSDDATPASFVSCDGSREEEGLAEIDLLPRIRHKSLLTRDMATWFGGAEETIQNRMAKMAHLMDGDGYTRDSGTHGRRGYTGDYRFTFIGASTPLTPRAWKVMGHTGYRFVFYNLPSEHMGQDELKEALFSGDRYPDKVSTCREIVHEFLDSLWDDKGGYSGENQSFEFTEDAKEAIAYLGRLVKFSRATLRNEKDSKVPQREDPKRVGAVLRDIAQGRALLEGRTEVRAEDVRVSARIALSSMPRKRRPIVRELLNPDNNGRLYASEAEEYLEVSRPTALNRMEIIQDLGIAATRKDEDDGRDPVYTDLKDDLQWPDCLEFPDFGGG